ncbi:MAG TPA: hypothetical protein VMU48_17880 [Terracidiphilus sp.]|nr:hypothetical protein [Terracidiphilus sp.]
MAPVAHGAGAYARKISMEAVDLRGGVTAYRGGFENFEAILRISSGAVCSVDG